MIEFLKHWGIGVGVVGLIVLLVTLIDSLVSGLTSVSGVPTAALGCCLFLAVKISDFCRN